MESALALENGGTFSKGAQISTPGFLMKQIDANPMVTWIKMLFISAPCLMMKEQTYLYTQLDNVLNLNKG